MLVATMPCVLRGLFLPPLYYIKKKFDLLVLLISRAYRIFFLLITNNDEFYIIIQQFCHRLHKTTISIDSPAGISGENDALASIVPLPSHVPRWICFFSILICYKIRGLRKLDLWC